MGDFFKDPVNPAFLKKSSFYTETKYYEKDR